MKIAITLGDPAGIGPEIILKALSSVGKKDTFIFGSKKILKKTARDLHLESYYRKIKDLIVDCIKDYSFQYGKPNTRTGRMALASINAALKFNPDILITPPIVKDAIRNSIPEFIGHTEYLGEFFCVKNFAMIGFSGNYRLMFLTTHIPLRSVFRFITAKNISKKLELFNWGLKKYFSIPRPHIGVCAVNPHGFEFSQGEEEKIKEGIKMTKEVSADGPYPADTIFNRNFDGYLTVYHDQAMIFLKSKRDGLNWTLGLPIVRLSPLYGAALDIAGKNIARYSGLVNAIKEGIRLYQRGKRYDKKI
jgi:4-hydroxythreonine-4-phosphate dehydrogenase